MNLSIVLLILVTVASVVATPVSAVTLTPTVAPSTTTANPAITQTQTTTTAGTPLVSLQTRASGEIDRRLNSLQGAIESISQMKKISAEEKTALTASLQTEVTKLTDLKAKIAGATDLTTLKADVATIVSQYRIFALILPKTHLLASADVIGTTIDDLTVLATKLEARITQAEAQGMSVISLKRTHTAMLDKIADANKQYESIITNVSPLIPDGYPANRSTLTNARTLLTTARKNLAGASTDAKSLMTSLKAFRPTDATTPASSVSAIPTTGALPTNTPSLTPSPTM